MKSENSKGWVDHGKVLKNNPLKLTSLSVGRVSRCNSRVSDLESKIVNIVQHIVILDVPGTSTNIRLGIQETSNAFVAR